MKIATLYTQSLKWILRLFVVLFVLLTVMAAVGFSVKNFQSPFINELLWLFVLCLNILLKTFIITLGYIVLNLFLNTRFREQLLQKILGIREADEREALLAGKASKSSFLFSICAGVVFLVLSASSYNAFDGNKLKPDNTLVIGNIHFFEVLNENINGDLMERYKQEGFTLMKTTPQLHVFVKNASWKEINSTNVIDLPTGVMILILFFIQITMYHVFFKLYERKF